MNITGRVLYNCRGMLIHGYPCFMNIAPLAKTKQMTLTGDQQFDSPFSGYPKILGIDSNSSKFSPCSLYCQNYASMEITSDDLVGTGYVTTTYTAAAWQKGIPFIPQNNLGQKDQYGQTSIGCLYTNSDILYNSNLKVARIHDNNKSWQDQTLNIDFMDNDWHYYAITSDNSRMRIFLDGKKIFDKQINGKFHNYLFVEFRAYGQHRYVDDVVCILDQCLWTDDFTPPTDYLLGTNYTIDQSKLRRNNIIASTVNPKVIFPDDDILKVY